MLKVTIPECVLPVKNSSEWTDSVIVAPLSLINSAGISCVILQLLFWYIDVGYVVCLL